MPNKLVKSEYFSGQGVCLMGDRDAQGRPMGLKAVGNVPELTLNSEVTTFKHKESFSGVRAVDKEIVQEIAVNLNVTFESLDKDNLALGSYGTASDIESGTVTGEAHVAYLGKYIVLDNIQVSSVVATGLAEGEYTVYPESGSILVHADAAVTDGTEVTFAYSFAAQEQVDMFTTGVPPVKWFRFEGLNTAEDNSPVIIDCFKMSPKPLQELALINEELASMPVEASLLSDELRTSGSKFVRVRKLPKA
jgi:hypothetical protein